MVHWRGRCGSLEGEVRFIRGGGVVHWRGGVVHWRGGVVH